MISRPTNAQARSPGQVWLLTVGLFLVPLGCSKPPSNASPFGLAMAPTGVNLTGKVTCDGTPVPSGGVQVIDKQGRLAGFGRITDGTYTVYNAPEGPVLLTVTAKELPPPMLAGPGAGPGRPPGPPGGGMPPGLPGPPGGMPGGPPGGPPGAGPGGPPGAPRGGHPGGPPGGPPGGAPGGSGRPAVSSGRMVPLPSRPGPDQPTRELTEEQKKMLQAIAKKYGKPETSDLRTTVRKGENVFDLNLTLP